MENQDGETTETAARPEPPPGTWASVAREMAAIFKPEPGEPPFDFDRWKDEMKDADW